MKPTLVSQAAPARSMRRFRWVPALAVLLVPVLAHPAAAQQRDRGSVVSFRNDVAQTDSRLEAPPAAVWQAMTEVYGEMGFPLAETANPHAHDYLTPFMDLRGRLFNKANSTYFSCSGYDILNDLTNTGQITFAVRTRLSAAEGGGTMLHTQVDARARRRGGSASAVECSTTGEFEKTLARMVDERLQQSAARPAGQTAPAAPPAPAQPE
jgi:hypothetical protein